MLVKKRPCTGRALVITASFTMVMISVAFFNIETKAPIKLLHIGPLTQQIEEQALQNIGSGIDTPAPEQLIASDSANLADVLSRPTHELRDLRTERKAEVGANRILGSYDVIMSQPQEAQGHYKSKIHSIEVEEPTTEFSTPSHARSKSNGLPNFVLRARAEIAHADYIRNHNEPTPVKYPPVQAGAGSRSKSSKTRHSSADSKSERRDGKVDFETGTRTATEPEPRTGEPKGNARQFKKGPMNPTTASKSSFESTIQTLVKNAVQSAMRRIEKVNKVDKVSPTDMRRLGHYISQAEAARIRLASPSTSSAIPVGSLRTAQEKVLAKRVAQAQALLSKLVKQHAPATGVQPNAPVIEGTPVVSEVPLAASSQDPASRSLAREGLLPNMKGEPPLSVPATIRAIRDGQSEFSEEERHLQSQIDTIFGSPPPLDDASRSTMSQITSLRQRSPTGGLSAATGGLSAATQSPLRPARDARPKKERAQESEELVRQKSEELEILKLEDQVKHMQEEKRLTQLKRQLRQMQERLKVRQLKEQVLKEQQLVQLRKHQQALAEAEEQDKAEKPEEEEEEEAEMVRVCSPLGCHMEPVLPTVQEHKPQHFTPPSNRSDVRAWVDKTLDAADIWNSVLPWGSWKESWEPEVGLDENGTIVAAHDDPNGHLTPRNPYQEEAVYPDGPHHEAPSPGISNMLGEHLFDDNIVVAAPGFNAGAGRHVRTQQAADWQRNWGSQIVKGKKVLVH